MIKQARCFLAAAGVTFAIGLGTRGVCAEPETVLGMRPDDPCTQLQDYLGLPNTIGYVSDSNLLLPNQLPEFILIQDVHKHPEVQANVAAMLIKGYRQWGVRKVFLEGAFAAVDVDPFQAIPDGIRNLLLGRLINEGNLSGAELAAVLLSESDKSGPYVSPFQLIGMEDADLYRRNLQVYQQVQERRARALEELASIEMLQHRLGIPSRHPLAQQLQRTRLLIQLKLTPEEYSDFIRNKAATPHSAQLDEAVSAALHFYHLVQARSWTFVTQMNRKLPAWKGPRLCVVGGFHTAFMTEALRKAGKSYVVLTPRITQSGLDALYEQQMSEIASALQVRNTTHN
jgi:hypothetical protein